MRKSILEMEKSTLRFGLNIISGEAELREPSSNDLIELATTPGSSMLAMDLIKDCTNQLDYFYALASANMLGERAAEAVLVDGMTVVIGFEQVENLYDYFDFPKENPDLAFCFVDVFSKFVGMADRDGFVADFEKGWIERHGVKPVGNEKVVSFKDYKEKQDRNDG